MSGKHIKKSAAIIREATKAFAGIQPGDSARVGTGKVALVAAKRVIYTVADYWLAALWAAISIALQVWGLHLLAAFAVMWGVSILMAGFFLAIYARTGHDLSLGEDLRRASDAIREKSMVAGYLSMLGVVVQATVWSGPEQVVIFFRKEIGAMPKMVAVLLFLTALQTVVWMYLYRTGYDSISQLL